jgi:hypothetical protein
MSVLTEVLDRLSGIAALKERVIDLTTQLAEMRRLMLEQQKNLAEVQGQIKALIALRSGRR